MRFTHWLFLTGILALAVGCSAPPAAVQEAPSPASANAANPPTALIATRADAIAAGTNFLQAEGWRWLDGPRPVFVEQMSYRVAHQYIPMLGEDPNLSPELPVWLVLYQGRWQLLPYGQTNGPPAPTIYEGCQFVLFTALDGSVLARGDSTCPAQ